MMALLSPRFWFGLALVAALTFTHVFVYKSGRSAVRIEWDKERAVQMDDALAASETFLQKEKALNASNLKDTNDYIAHKKISAAAAVVSAGRLSELQAAVDSAASASAGAVSGDHGDPRSSIITQCAGTVVILDEAVKRLANQTSALQEFTRGVCLNK